MSKERALLIRAFTAINSIDFPVLCKEIEELLAQPEKTEPVEICPDCGSKVTWYHCRDECFTKGDL